MATIILDKLFSVQVLSSFRHYRFESLRVFVEIYMNTQT